jgi:Dyp-type peroxidase family
MAHTGSTDSTDSKARTRSTGLRGQTNLAVLADVKPGMVRSYEPITYVERLRKVLAALQSARENLRESELRPPFFPDTVGRLEIIHHFRYALVEPQQPGLPSRLSLNVTFDGGWEPYMRVIYRDIGPLLDLLFCHSGSYPGSHASYEEYCNWVRGNEVQDGLFFADSPLTLLDQRYLAEVERTQRERGGTDLDLARVALPSGRAQMQAAMKAAANDPVGALMLPLRTLKGLYRLSVYFPSQRPAGGGPDDMTILRRFAQSVLADAITLMQRLDQGNPPPPWQQAKVQFADELAWLDYANVAPERKPPSRPCVPAKLQSHLLGSADEKATHGCLVLLRVRKGAADRAVMTLQQLATRCGPLQAGGIAYLVAFTYAGLEELGIHPGRLGRMPQEFFEGMEARHALLGDLRGNHPDRWTRPLWWKQGAGQRVALDAVHVVIQLRMQVPGPQDSDPGLHATLRQEVEQFAAADNGLRVLAVEPLRSYRTDGQVTGHMGVADGLSQPAVVMPNPAPQAAAASGEKKYDDLVATGELLLGYGNDRGDRGDDLDDLLMDGSFLVVRKLRQRIDHLEEALVKAAPAPREEVLAKMVGRGSDGKPLGATVGPHGPNDFNYDDPAASDGCPFHSHVRRANPRDGRAYTPRILRRGMSYGPLPTAAPLDADRGVMFMAYCASIAEQFETIQRWVAGGNSSGVGSAQADPLLRVPQQGEDHVFRYLDAKGQVVRVHLGDKPLVQLQWGLYLFVPALPVLRELALFRAAPVRDTVTRPQPEPETPLEKMRAALEDRTRSADTWAQVRADPGAWQDTAYGELVGTLDRVLQVLRDDGAAYSVRGYGQRMAASVGLTLLGMDAGAARDRQAGVRAAIEAVTQRAAFDLTLAVVNEVLRRVPDLPRTPDDIVRRPIDLVNFSDAVLAILCNKWFGIPQYPDPARPGAKLHMVQGGRVMHTPTVPRCPGNLASASKYIFSPHPREEAVDMGQKQGASALQAVRDWLADPQRQLGPVARDILAELAKTKAEDTLDVNMAGVLLGFAPTVQGNFLTVMRRWITEQPSLWQLQQDLYEVSQQAALTHEEAGSALLRPLLDAMRREPVPGMLWRERAGLADGAGAVPPVVLGMGSALANPTAPDELLFGRDDANGPTPHGCPGMEMGKGVLLGMIGGLLKAGTLRPTGSPVLLILTPNS